MPRRTPDPEIPCLLLDEEGVPRCWVCDAELNFDDSLDGAEEGNQAEAWFCTNGDCDKVLVIERTMSGAVASAKWGRRIVDEDEAAHGVFLPTYVVGE